MSDLEAALNDAAALALALAVDKSATVEMEGENWFLHVHNLTYVCF